MISELKLFTPNVQPPSRKIINWVKAYSTEGAKQINPNIGARIIKRALNEYLLSKIKDGKAVD